MVLLQKSYECTNKPFLFIKIIAAKNLSIPEEVTMSTKK